MVLSVLLPKNWVKICKKKKNSSRNLAVDLPRIENKHNSGQSSFLSRNKRAMRVCFLRHFDHYIICPPKKLPTVILPLHKAYARWVKDDQQYGCMYVLVYETQLRFPCLYSLIFWPTLIYFTNGQETSQLTISPPYTIDTQL